MGAILEKELKKEIFSDDYEYFFSFLTDRFEYATELWIKELEKKFNKRFKPVWIFSAKQSDLFMSKKENYIIINRKLKEIKKNLQKNNYIELSDYEDLNKEFSESRFISGLIQDIVKKQGRVFILSFTSSFLNINNKEVVILGPDPKIATSLDNKVEHIKLFEKLDLPRNKTKIYNNIEEIKKDANYPFYISASYSSGGHESKIIYQESDLDIFYLKIRDINKSSEFIVSMLIKDIKLSPNVNAIVYGDNKTEIIFITDQILRGNQYLGNIYPSKANEKIKEDIINVTKKVGNYMSSLGFRGIFGLDFIIDLTGNLYTVDLNPRRQGGYLCNILASSKVNIIELELKLAIKEEIQIINKDSFFVNYCWAHSKIKPYYSDMQIGESFKEGEPMDPFNQIGSKYIAIFYPKGEIFGGGCIGYYITTGNNWDSMKQNFFEEIEKTLSKRLNMYLT